MTRPRLSTALAAVLLPLLALPAAGATRHHTGGHRPVHQRQVGAHRYDVTVRVTEHGIPHIEARDFASLGYGYGYELAGQDVCILADTYVTVRAQRSRWFGPQNGYVFRGNGASVNNLTSDFFFQQVNDDHRVERLLAARGRDAVRPEVRQIVRGYVDGYNRWLADHGGAAGVRDPACHGAPWVTPITEIDAYRRFYQLALLASSGVAIDGIGGAQPPTPSAPVPALSPAALSPAALAGSLARDFTTLAIGSNAVALGSAATATHRGLLLGNPHFPWIGSERFFQAQLTVPGRLDVEGGSLLGVPLVLIGHTAHQAWSHTVSTAFRFTPFQETLVPGSPTTYLVDGRPTPMTSRTVTVQELVGGTVQPVSRTLWSTRHGSVFTSLLGLPFPWTSSTAFVMGDANAVNFRYLNHFFDVDRAQSVPDVLSTLRRNQGIPWVNTIAADDRGRALYADISVTPHVTDDQASSCDTALGAATFKALRLPVLDGSRTACDWGSDPDSEQPGTFGPSHMPSLVRADYVTNSNDSYWLSNPHQPLEGYARIIGDERAERTTRTRSGLVMVEQQLARGRFTRQALQDLLFSDRQHSFELTRDDLLAMCRSFGGQAPSSSGPVAVSDACDVLARWNGRDSLDARGALLFRRFWERANAVPTSVGASTQRSPVWAVPFDASDPVHTPRGLNTGNPKVQQAFGDALRDLSGAGIPVDAPLGQFEADVRPDGTRVPLHGGPGTDGVFDAVNLGWDPAHGYVERVAHGSSYIQVVSFTGAACPDTRTILTYSQSADPTSPYYADQTRLFSRGAWVTERFCSADVRRHTRSTLRLRG